MKTYGALRLPALRAVPRLQERPDQAVLPRLPRARLATSRCAWATARPPSSTPSGGSEDWEITFVETGLLTGTGAPASRGCAHYLDRHHFLLTYGDGIGDVDLDAARRPRTVASGRIGTVTGVHPASRYGEMHVDGARRRRVQREADARRRLGQRRLLRLRARVRRRVPRRRARRCCSSTQPLQQLARDGELSVFPHEGFWMGMDTYRDWTELNALWDRGAGAVEDLGGLRGP